MPPSRSCRVCDGTDLELAVDLGMHPWCNNFLKPEDAGKEAYYPLRVVFCQGCKTAQLDFTVEKETLFGDHTYLSGVTRTLDAHFRDVAGTVDQAFFRSRSRKTVLDIGSNDGTQLKHFKALGYDVLGVESSKATARIASERGIDTVNEFFNLDLAGRLNRKFHVINAAGVFFHLEELHSVTDGIRTCLEGEGVFVVQFLYMKCILENKAFDQIYHEHLLYYTLRTLQALLCRHGLELFDAQLSPIHGGSIIGFATHAGKRKPSARLNEMMQEEDREGTNELASYRRFAQEILQMKKKDVEFLQDARGKGKVVFGMGAPAKGNTLLNYFKIGTDLIRVLVEKNRLRKGLVSPGMHIPIALEDELPSPPDIYYVLAWNFRKEILENNAGLVKRGVRFYFPVEPKES